MLEQNLSRLTQTERGNHQQSSRYTTSNGHEHIIQTVHTHIQLKEEAGEVEGVSVSERQRSRTCMIGGCLEHGALKWHLGHFAHQQKSKLFNYNTDQEVLLQISPLLPFNVPQKVQKQLWVNFLCLKIISFGFCKPAQSQFVVWIRVAGAWRLSRCNLGTNWYKFPVDFTCMLFDFGKKLKHLEESQQIQAC